MSLLPICPGSLLTAAAGTRPAVILPGLGNNTGDYQGLAMALRERYGIPSVVARVSRFDWLRYAAGLLDPSFWKGTLGPRPVLDWYLERVHEAVSEANQLSPQDKGIPYAPIFSFTIDVDVASNKHGDMALSDLNSILLIWQLRHLINMIRLT
ncbi:hypothetical protein COCNU_10G008970 [Cocos nucifera]|uniref:Uncharacterized protein n=1 Tax=Cocos nucifera TaxID=13894 RepID=A0A8K0N8J9_COCNU|nr:hypothetical protein COCNU_10G008970 [Cocos nucifera]